MGSRGLLCWIGVKGVAACCVAGMPPSGWQSRRTRSTDALGLRACQRECYEGGQPLPFSFRFDRPGAHSQRMQHDDNDCPCSALFVQHVDLFPLSPDSYTLQNRFSACPVCCAPSPRICRVLSFLPLAALTLRLLVACPPPFVQAPVPPQRFIPFCIPLRLCSHIAFWLSSILPILFNLVPYVLAPWRCRSDVSHSNATSTFCNYLYIISSKKFGTQPKEADQQEKQGAARHSCGAGAEAPPPPQQAHHGCPGVV
jgi:hypothetical protein